MHKLLLATAALSLAAPGGLLAQELPPGNPPPPPESAEPAPPAPPAPPSPPRAPTPPAASTPLPATAPAPGGARIEFVKEPVIQTAPEPKTGDRPVCRGEVVDSCIQPGAARQQGR